jgi:hypothetical protein
MKFRHQYPLDSFYGTVSAQTDGEEWQNRHFIFLIFIVNPPNIFNTFLVEE